MNKEKLILYIRTDKPVAELYLKKDDVLLGERVWLAHRELSETIHSQLAQLLEAQGSTLRDLGCVVVYRGPGSFTGIRIGVSIANALAESLRIPIIGLTGDTWLTDYHALTETKGELVTPLYGQEAHITAPKK